jgi:hypothetical protein
MYKCRQTLVIAATEAGNKWTATKKRKNGEFELCSQTAFQPIDKMNEVFVLVSETGFSSQLSVFNIAVLISGSMLQFNVTWVLYKYTCMGQFNISYYDVDWD